MSVLDDGIKDEAPRSFWSNPYLIAGASMVLMLAGLAIAMHFAIGPSYWDLSIYLDAAHRIANGQKPNVDFLTPAVSASPAPGKIVHVTVSADPSTTACISY